MDIRQVARLTLPIRNWAKELIADPHSMLGEHPQTGGDVPSNDATGRGTQDHAGRE